MIRLPLPTQLSYVLLTLLAMTAPLPAIAQQEPVAVVAVSSLEGLLNDVDYLFDAAGHPQHSLKIREVLANLNELRGLDRTKPAGVLLHFPSVEQRDPRPLFFFPVESLEELLRSVQIGDSLRLERTDTDDRLTLRTDDGVIPVKLQHGYAFLDPTKSPDHLEQPMLNPQQLLQGVIGQQDAVLLIRREGIPPFLFETVRGQLTAETVKAQLKNSRETDAEHAFRRDATRSALSLADAVLTDWRSTTIGLTLSEKERRLGIQATVSLADDGETSRFLSQISGSGLPANSSLPALAVSTKWQPTPVGRDLLGQLLTMLRQQVEPHIAQADPSTQSAIEGVLDAIDATTRKGKFDASIQLRATSTSGFVLLSRIAVFESKKMAAGLEQLLPLAASSPDIRSIDMAVARPDDVEIHRVVPMSLRKRDERLYGKGAAIYLAAGNGSLWLSLGGAEALDQLTSAIFAASPRQSTLFVIPDHPPLLRMEMHARDWVGFARNNGDSKNARIAELARAAFAAPDDDHLELTLAPTSDGLQLLVTLDEGYIRLIGMTLAKSVQQD